MARDTGSSVGMINQNARYHADMECASREFRPNPGADLMTAHAPVAHIYLRLFEPRAFSFAAPMFGAPALLKLPPAPPCALCEARTVPAIMGWTEIFGDVRTLIVCSECADGAKQTWSIACTKSWASHPRGRWLLSDASGEAGRGPGGLTGSSSILSVRYASGYDVSRAHSQEP